MWNQLLVQLKKNFPFLPVQHDTKINTKFKMNSTKKFSRINQEFRNLLS